MKVSTNQIARKNEAKKFIFNNYSFSILLTILVEVFYFDSLHLEINIENLIFFGILFMFAFGVVSWIRNAIASNEIFFDDSIRPQISTIINEAKEYIFIVTPYFSPGETLLRQIIQVAKSGLKVTIIHNSKELENPDFLKILKRLNNLCSVYNHPHLHSKLYFNESEMIITSLNLHKSSMMNSFEVGWLTNRYEEFGRVKNYVNKIIIKDNLTSITDLSKVEEKLGYCIRTKKRILLNKDRPIEISEYYKSKRASDGSYCHKCGEESDTSIDNPFCKNHQSLFKELL